MSKILKIEVSVGFKTIHCEVELPKNWDKWDQMRQEEFINENAESAVLDQIETSWEVYDEDQNIVDSSNNED